MNLFHESLYLPLYVCMVLWSWCISLCLSLNVLHLKNCTLITLHRETDGLNSSKRFLKLVNLSISGKLDKFCDMKLDLQNYPSFREIEKLTKYPNYFEVLITADWKANHVQNKMFMFASSRQRVQPVIACKVRVAKLHNTELLHTSSISIILT